MGSELLIVTDRSRRRVPRCLPLDARPHRRQGLRGRRDWPEDGLPPQRRVRPRQHREEPQRRRRDHRGRPHRPLLPRSLRREPLPPRRRDRQGRRDSVEPSCQGSRRGRGSCHRPGRTRVHGVFSSHQQAVNLRSTKSAALAACRCFKPASRLVRGQGNGVVTPGEGPSLAKLNR